MISLLQVPPAELVKYELIEEIGHGGMATVFRARDKRLQREVALKLLHRHLRESSEIEARFSAEARAVAKLRHPNIVAVYDVSGEDEPERYLVMELVRGITLRQMLKERGSLPVELAAAIVLEIAAALEHAHAEGVIHRDIKPENVLIETSRPEPHSGEDAEPARVKLTDFGIAKLLDAQGVTSTGQVLGSPAHMAPEQIEGRVVDRRADIFSLGVLFYECVVGTLPFEGRNPAQVLRNVLEGNYEPPDRVRPEVGARWSRLLVKTLERDPNARPASIASFAAAVRAELDRVGMSGARHEVAAYLADPDGYCESFTNRLIEGLRRSGLAARSARDVPLAAAQFNRALAYRPQDRELLRLVSGLRWQRRLSRVGVGLVAAASLAGLAVFVVRSWPEAPVDAEPEPESPSMVPEAPRPDTPSGPGRGPGDPQGTLDTSPGGDVQRPNHAKPRPRPRENPVEARREPVPTAPAELRQVSVRITGAVGGSLRIDGKERPWFGGVVHELEVGEHLFEFVPPNDTCCVPTSRRVAVQPGQGVQLVVGSIPFKDARLDMMNGTASGWSVSCPTLFAGTMALPGARSVPMSQVKAQGSCVLTHAEGSATREKVVTLAAGQTTILPWP